MHCAVTMNISYQFISEKITYDYYLFNNGKGCFLIFDERRLEFLVFCKTKKKFITRDYMKDETSNSFFITLSLTKWFRYLFNLKLGETLEHRARVSTEFLVPPKLPLVFLNSIETWNMFSIS